jgi:hypothetical protein
MGFELIAAIVAAVACGGFVHLLRRMTGERLPRWLVPASAAAGLILFTLWSEYDWFGRVSRGLPEGVEVAWSESEASALRPWTFLVPLTTRFVAVDTREMKRHPAKPELHMATVYSFARWQPPVEGLMVVDCAAGRRVMVTDSVTISDAGDLVGGEWIDAGAQDGFRAAVCGEG